MSLETQKAPLTDFDVSEIQKGLYCADLCTIKRKIVGPEQLPAVSPRAGITMILLCFRTMKTKDVGMRTPQGVNMSELT